MSAAPTLFSPDTVLSQVSSAEISADGLYRYQLTRRWQAGPRATFVMLNPSTADASVDDPTIRRCIGFAKSWGCGGIVVVNLFAFRATSPQDMLAASDPVGPYGDYWLRDSVNHARIQGFPLIAAWGAHALSERVAAVRRLTAPAQFQCLGLTKSGQPRHPLYVRADANLIPWPQGGAA